MYVWDPEFSLDRFNGLIVIEASSTEEARMKAIGYMLKYISDGFLAEYYLDYDDLESGEKIVNGWNLFINDINQEPMVLDYIFYKGCDYYFI